MLNFEDLISEEVVFACACTAGTCCSWVVHGLICI